MVPGWVEEYRTGTGSDRVMDSTQNFERRKIVARSDPGEWLTRSLRLPVLYLSAHDRLNLSTV